MARKSTDDLFRLIRSLTQSEKRNFRIFSRRHISGKQVRYAALFDAIAKQKTYDEKKLLRENPWLNPALFPDQKKKLYALLLRSLSVHFHSRDVEAAIRYQMNCADFLASKNLARQSRRFVAAAARLALRHEKMALYAECLSREKNIVFASFSLKTGPRLIRHLDAEIAHAFLVLQNHASYKRLSGEMFMILSEETFVRSAKNRARSKKIISHPLMVSPEKTLSVRARYEYLRTCGLYSYAHTDNKSFFRFSRDIVSLIEKHPHILAESPEPYLVALQNLSIAQKNLSLYSDVFATLRKMRKTESGDIKTRARIFSVSTDIELTVFIDTCQFSKGAMMANAVEKGLAEFRGYVSPSHEILFYFNLGYNFLGAGYYKKALLWINRVINHPMALSALPVIFHMANLLFLILHFELGNHDLLDYRLRSAKQKFSRSNTLYELEGALIRFLSKAIVAGGEKNLQALFRELHKELLALQRDPENRRAFATFDFALWAESGFAGKTMEIRHREKQKTRHRQRQI